MQTELILNKSLFTEYLVRLNALRFVKWIFEPGMFFRSEIKWWGDKGPRGHQHNGLDLVLYEAADGTIEALGKETKVPIVYDGRIVNVIKDFLGYSVFAVHDIHIDGSRLYTIYGHVLPDPGVSVGNLLSEGSMIGAIAGDSDTEVPSHLHISVAFIPEALPPKGFTWDLLDNNDSVLFIDPQRII